jgi:ABC-2 type transport system ATP-binding protein
MNGGKIAVTGSPKELKEKLGGDVVSVTVSGQNGGVVLDELGYRQLSQTRDGVFDLVMDDGECEIPRILEQLREHEIETKSVSLKQATLDDVFLQYAGKRIGESETEWKSIRATRRTAKRLGR